MTRIGLFGSSFDPPHIAHLAMARLALGWGLDEIWWIPAATPPHKLQQERADMWDRFAMAVLTIQDESDMRVDPLELERGGVSYTVDTLRELRERHPEVEWFLLMGEDTWLTLGTWHEIAEFPKLTSFMVFGREDFPPGPDHPFPDLPGVIHFPVFDIPISSRTLREAIMRDDVDWPEQVTPAVAHYIRQAGLYGAVAPTKAVLNSDMDVL
jgi:nicotinate-nucleotide adenylyltransferase